MYRSLILATSTVALLAASGVSAQSRKRSNDAPAASVGRTPMTAPVEDAQTAPAAGAPTTAAPGQTAPVQGTAPAAPAAAPAAPAPTTTIAQALPTLPAHATLNKLIAATDLGATLAGPGPFTVFAPTDEAFSRMPAGALDTLLAPGNKPTLTRILQYHVVPGKLTAEAIKAQITAGGGSAKLTTANGEQLTASLGENGNVMLTDVNNVKSYVSQADLDQTNGIVHITNGVVFPKLG